MVCAACFSFFMLDAYKCHFGLLSFVVVSGRRGGSLLGILGTADLFMRSLRIYGWTERVSPPVMKITVVLQLPHFDYR